VRQKFLGLDQTAVSCKKYLIDLRTTSPEKASIQGGQTAYTTQNADYNACTGYTHGVPLLLCGRQPIRGPNSIALSSYQPLTHSGTSAVFESSSNSTFSSNSKNP
jgi:hypothetical protein